jgi:hypothetical protein
MFASCLNDACRHTALVNVSSYPADTEVPWFRTRVVCAKRGGPIFGYMSPITICRVTVSVSGEA